MTPGHATRRHIIRHDDALESVSHVSLSFHPLSQKKLLSSLSGDFAVIGEIKGFRRSCISSTVEINSSLSPPSNHMDPTQDRTDRKRQKDHIDMLYFVTDSEYGIPKKCPCGGGIMNEVRGEEEYDTVPRKRFFTCINYEDNGLHYRQPWAVAVQEEFEKLWLRMEKAEEVIKGASTINQQIEFLEGHVKTLNEQVEFLSVRIADMERLCFE